LIQNVMSLLSVISGSLLCNTRTANSGIHFWVRVPTLLPSLCR
jgi:hypothetical protein